MKASVPARRKKQSWPFIRKRVYPSGKIGWLVDGRTANGGEKRIFETIAEAETHAEQCRVRRMNEGSNSFGNADLARHGKTVQDAINYYLAYLDGLERSVPIEDAVTELIDARRKAGKSERYCYDLKIRLKRFTNTFPKRAAATFTLKELDAWLAGLQMAPGTRNTFRRDIRTLFSFCERRGYVQSNEAKHTEIATKVARAVEILTVDQCEDLLKACQDDTRAVVAISLFAGLRSCEVKKLDWSKVDFESGLIEVTVASSKAQAKRRHVPMSENLVEWIKPLAKKAGPVAPLSLRKRLAAVREKAGLAEWPVNAARHSFASYRLEKIQDAAKVALEMGNSPAVVFAHYRELVKPKAAEAFWKLSPAK